VKANQATHPVRVMCRLLKVSASGFYAWEERPLSSRARTDIALTAQIHAIHRRSKGAYGAPMIHAELADDHDIHVGCKRVARLMRAAQLRGVSPKRFVHTTISEANAASVVGAVPSEARDQVRELLKLHKASRSGSSEADAARDSLYRSDAET